VKDADRALLLAAEDEILGHCTRCHGHGYDPDGGFDACGNCGGGGTLADVERRDSDFDDFLRRNHLRSV